MGKALQTYLFKYYCSSCLDIDRNLVCKQSSKKSKTKGALKLHHNKHSIDVIDDNKNHERHYVKETIKKTFKKVLEEKLHSELVIKGVQNYWEVIIEDDIIDFQNKLLTLNFHEEELFYSI